LNLGFLCENLDIFEQHSHKVILPLSVGDVLSVGCEACRGNRENERALRKIGPLTNDQPPDCPSANDMEQAA
jgi:hypothetical protein